MHKRLFFNQRGSGFIELMIALTVLSVTLLALIPSFMYASKATLRNNFRTNAYNLGIRQLERIKSLDYENVGIKNGNPSGVTDYRKIENRAGVSYTVKTVVIWMDDSADGFYPKDKDPRDYKKIKVTVSPPIGSGLPTQVYTTDITRQSQEQIASGGNIEVSVVDTAGGSLEDYKVKITDGPSGAQESFTDATGKYTFVMLDESVEEGDYNLTAEKEGYVLEPTLINQTTTVRAGETRMLRFLASEPGQVNVSLLDDDTGQPIQSETKISLLYPSASPLESTTTQSTLMQDLFPGVYEVKAENDSYEMSSETDVLIEVNKTTRITLRMKKKKQGNMHLTVLENGTNRPVSNANVLITGQDIPLTVRDITNVQGILEKQLGQQTFNLEVSKSSYQTSTTTFSITHTGNTFVRVALRKNSPTSGSIRVTVRNRNGNPRANVRIRAYGPTISRGRRYLVTLVTDSNGETLFDNLRPGRYYVYRWRWGWRRIGWPMINLGVEKTYDVRY